MKPKEFTTDNVKIYTELISCLIRINVLHPITYIEWYKTGTDTINCEFDRNGNSEICKKVWFKNQFVRQTYNAERLFLK